MPNCSKAIGFQPGVFCLNVYEFEDEIRRLIQLLALLMLIMHKV